MKEEMITKKFTVELKKEDYELLKEWDYYFEGNIKQMIEDHAKEMRFYIQEAKAT